MGAGSSRRRRYGAGPAAAVAIALGTLVLAAPARAYLLIDDFRDPQTLVLGEDESEASGSVVAFGAAAGERDAVLARLDATPGALTLAVAGSGADRLVVAGPAVPAALTLVYDGADGDPAIDPTGLGDLDLTELGTEDRLALRLRADHGATLRVQAFDTGDASGSTWSAGEIEVAPSTSLRWVELPLLALDDPGPAGPADLRDVGAILVAITAPDGLVLQLDEIRVPEAGQAVGGATALLVLAALRRSGRARACPVDDFRRVR